MEKNAKIMLGVGSGILVGCAVAALVKRHNEKKTANIAGLVAGSLTSATAVVLILLSEEKKQKHLPQIPSKNFMPVLCDTKIRDSITGYEFIFHDDKKEIESNKTEWRNGLFDVSELKSGYLRWFKIAIKELRKTKRGNFLIQELENTEQTIKVVMTNNGTNQYTPSKKLLEWDANCFLGSYDSKVIDPITLLGHEIGHCWQDLVKHSLGKGRNDEQENIELNEWPIAKERGNYIRKGHDEILARFYRTLPIFIN
ncbi:MAG: hypothetical protein IJP61_12800 [Treponema sp.]|nr:hypothetical protein [Treponema sp.]